MSQVAKSKNVYELSPLCQPSRNFRVLKWDIMKTSHNMTHASHLKEEIRNSYRYFKEGVS
jgi:hypothetical protein